MSVQNSAFHWNRNTLVLHIMLQPRASKNEWSGFFDGKIRLRVTAAPVDNLANRECEKFVAKALKTAKTNVRVVRGHNSRTKTVEIQQADSKSWQNILAQLKPVHPG
ncbi:MAG: DUF167 domain-containing protein [SAR324 cluster bacterium]|nr:DUF167 domain-containing protein [SAR324 cluster bacterium]MBL7035109.1 DUF167 domain-containing protein [SAR324 cluster bacterium]